jgi:hypothetical protein
MLAPQSSVPDEDRADTKQHGLTDNCTPLDANASQRNPVYRNLFLKHVSILSSHLRRGRPVSLFPSSTASEPFYAPVISPMRTTCPAHHLPGSVISAIKEEQILLRFSTCNYLQCIILPLPYINVIRITFITRCRRLALFTGESSNLTQIITVQ